MPTFAELLDRFSFLAAGPASVGVLATAALIVIILDWRVTVFIMACQAVLAGLLYSQVLPPQVAGVKLMVGLLITVQLFVTGQQMDRNRAARSKPQEAAPDHSRITTGLPFRIIAALMVALVSWQLSLVPDLALPEVSSNVALATFGLVGLGLLGLGLTEEPLKVGMLLITVLTGFELYYASVEPALAVIALLAAMDFSVALGACYLAVIRSLPERRAAE